MPHDLSHARSPTVFGRSRGGKGKEDVGKEDRDNVPLPHPSLSRCPPCASEYYRTSLAFRPWYAAGAPSRLDVPGAELATQINTMFRFVTTDLAIVYGGGDSGLTYLLKTLTNRIQEDPRADVDAMEQEFIDNVLAGAWHSAQRSYGRDPERWNEAARRQVLQRKLGAYESLDGFPSLDEALDMDFPPLACVDGATVFSQAAQAYVQWVPLADVDRAGSLLPPGTSERADSPMRRVNVDAWTRGELNPAPLSRKAVEQLAQSSRVLLPGEKR